MENNPFEIITQQVQENDQKIEHDNRSAFDIIFPIVLIIFVLVFLGACVMSFSSKFRGKMLSRQVKSLKHMVDESADDIEALSATLGGVSARTRKKILDENEDILADVTQREANIKKGYVKTMAKAVKEGFSGDEATAFCKHCGAMIDEDSTFCKKCGKRQ